MLTEREKHGIAELLHRLDSADLTSLAQTVTSRLIVPESTAEAVSAIVLHTDRAADLLRRRKLRKEFLFKYLHAKRVEGIDPAADKSVIISHVLALWGVNDQVPHHHPHHQPGLDPSALRVVDEDSCSLPEAPAPSRNTSYSSLCNLDLHSPLTGTSLPSAFPLQPNLGMILNRTYSDPSCLVAAGAAGAAGAAAGANNLRRTDSNLSMMTDDTASEVHQPHDPPPAIATNGTVITTNITSSQAQDLACTFVKWFYEMINGFCKESSSEFRPDHFFADADAKIAIQASASDASQPEFITVSKSGREVHSALSGIARKYGLTYNPNVSVDGVRGAIDPHGLVVVTACGTLHNASSVCGTFHQQFGLVRDPFDGNNWKIKFTNARLVSKTVVSEVPRLGDDSAMGVLELEMQQLQQQSGGGSGGGGTTAMALS